MMSNLQVRSHPPDEVGTVCDVTPHSAGWDYVGFRVCRLARGQILKGLEEEREVCC
jgi:5-deoxy-glucuronate isomerase